MIDELEKAVYDKARPLFQGMGHSQLFADAVFEGNHAGRIYVDAPEHPTAALLAPLCEFFFTAGRTDNMAFNQAMRALILSELVSSEGDLLLFPTSEAWQQALDKLFADFARLHVARKAFTFQPAVFAEHHTG